MSEPRVSVRATVTLTVEIDVSDAWGGDCAMSQVSKQARESALQVLANSQRADMPTVAEAAIRRMRVVGLPLVKAIAVEEDRR